MYTPFMKQRKAEKVLRKYKKQVGKEGDREGKIRVSEQYIRDMREAEQIKSDIYQKETGKLIFFPMRRSWFVAANLPIIVGMVSFQRTMVQVIFWQWLNQTYNTSLNYTHREQGREVSKESVYKAYGGAVTTSCVVGGLARRMGNKLGSGSLVRHRLINCGVAVAGMIGGGIVNLWLMREKELERGISIRDHEGKELGMSQRAARRSLIASTLTRAALPIPLFFVVPSLHCLLHKLTSGLRTSRHIQILDFIAVGLQLWVAMPLAFGLFNQHLTAPVKGVENHFAACRDSDGLLINTIYFDKGL